MSPIPLGILAASAAGLDSDFELIETQVLTSTASIVTFSGLGAYSTTYRHLQLRGVVNTASPSNQYLRFNGDSSSIYAWHYLTGNGSSVSSALGPVYTGLNWVIPNGGTDNFAAAVVDILDPFATKNTTIRSFFGSTKSGANWINLTSGGWFKTDSVTSISLGHGQDWAIGSRFSIYGRKG